CSSDLSGLDPYELPEERDRGGDDQELRGSFQIQVRIRVENVEEDEEYGRGGHREDRGVSERGDRAQCNVERVDVCYRPGDAFSCPLRMEEALKEPHGYPPEGKCQSGHRVARE